MQDAEAVALHSSLAAGEKARGAHGGLGFSAADGKSSSKDKKTKAEKSLMQSSTSSGRDFATTTAAAVAAGHWDPFSRPVAFKMKEVNRKVGGLYSMFVKGGTEGNTLKDSAADPATAAASSAAAGDDADKFNWKRAIKEALRAAPAHELRLKLLRKQVLSAHKRAAPQQAADADTARRTFKKRLKKMDGIKKKGKLVRLLPS